MWVCACQFASWRSSSLSRKTRSVENFINFAEELMKNCSSSIKLEAWTNVGKKPMFSWRLHASAMFKHVAKLLLIRNQRRSRLEIPDFGIPMNESLFIHLTNLSSHKHTSPYRNTIISHNCLLHREPGTTFTRSCVNLFTGKARKEKKSLMKWTLRWMVNLIQNKSGVCCIHHLRRITDLSQATASVWLATALMPRSRRRFLRQIFCTQKLF